MGAPANPRIISVDRMDNGAVVSFADGTTAHYSAALLHATLPQATAMPPEAEDANLPPAPLTTSN
jgi:hypothetical protein